MCSASGPCGALPELFRSWYERVAQRDRVEPGNAYGTFPAERQCPSPPVQRRNFATPAPGAVSFCDLKLCLRRHRFRPCRGRMTTMVVRARNCPTLAANRPATTGRFGFRSKAPLITRTAAILCRSISMAGLHTDDGGCIRASDIEEARTCDGS